MKYEDLNNRIYMCEINQEFLNTFNAKPLCPVCGSDDIKNDYCSKCKFDFSNVFECPLLDDNLIQESKRVCNVDRMICTVKGLNYETCEKYHKYSD